MNTPPLVPPRGLSRRTALKLVLTGAAGVAFGCASAAVAGRLLRATPAEFEFFSAEEARLLTEICEQIIPRDDVAGATEAGVIYYIDRQVGSGMLVKHGAAYKQGLAAFRATCAESHGKPFAMLPATAKLDLLRAIEMGKAPKALWPDPAQDAFFRMVIDHTMQGFYGSPRHGGNREWVSYRMLGLSYPQLVGQTPIRNAAT